MVTHTSRARALDFFLHFFDFWDFLDFYVGFWAREGLEMVRGWIRIHLDQVSAQMDHSGSIWGPFLISNFLEIHTGSHFGPNRP